MPTKSKKSLAQADRLPRSDNEQAGNDIIRNDNDSDHSMDEDDESCAQNDGSTMEPAEAATATKGKRKHGIVYLSTIPKHMTVAIARNMFEQYAAVGRMFFQPNDSKSDNPDSAAATTRKKATKRFRPQHFSEGWVEFLSKRAARAVAQRLNGQPIALRKGSKFADMLWSMKYLPRFKWVHLSERLTYEKAVHKQRLRAEVSQARREAQFFQENLDRSDKNKRLSKKSAKVTVAVAAAAKKMKKSA